MLTLEQLRKHVETDLPDEALQRVLDAEVASARAAIAGAVQRVETYHASGLTVLRLRYPASTVSQVVERRALSSDPVTLATNDWFLSGVTGLVRVSTGPNPAETWGAEVKVTYTPAVNESAFDLAVIGLVKLTLAFTGVESEESGDYKAAQTAYEAQRQALLRQALVSARILS